MRSNEAEIERRVPSNARKNFYSLGESLVKVEHFIFCGIDINPIHVRVVVIKKGDTHYAHFGVAITNISKDKYCRKIGHRVAMGRALHSAATWGNDVGLTIDADVIAAPFGECRDVLREMARNEAVNRLNNIITKVNHCDK